MLDPNVIPPPPLTKGDYVVLAIFITFPIVALGLIIWGVFG
jgi:hypothetical protein